MLALYHIFRINDGFVEKAQSAGEDSHEGRPYLVTLVLMSVVLYLGSLAAIGAMFHFFTNCPANDLVISLTLILSLVSVAIAFLGLGTFRSRICPWCRLGNVNGG